MNKVRVLVVEDEALIALDTRYQLENLGYDVTAIVSTGEDAVEIANKTNPDLILMDIMLGGLIDGIEASKRIKQTNDIPIIYTTAFCDANTLEVAKQDHPVGYLVKPYNEKDLVTALEIAMDHFRLEKRLREREQWFAAILKNMDEGLIATDTEKRIQTVNFTAQDILNIKQRDVLGKDISSVFKIMEQNDQIINDPISMLLRQENIDGKEEMVLTKANKKIKLNINVGAVRNESAEIIGFMILFKKPLIKI